MNYVAELQNNSPQHNKRSICWPFPDYPHKGYAYQMSVATSDYFHERFLLL